MKNYVGSGAETGDWRVEVHHVTTGRIVPLDHHVRHSPDGHAWGYEGSAPAELAKDILWDAAGAEPPKAVYMRFKREVIALLHQDRNFTMSLNSVLTWLVTDLAHHPDSHVR